jgi:hypothetical protein
VGNSQNLVDRVTRLYSAKLVRVYNRLGTRSSPKGAVVRKIVRAVITVFLACLVIEFLPVDAAFFLASVIVIGGIFLFDYAKVMMSAIYREFKRLSHRQTSY